MKPRGFTLVETLVVMFILGIITSVVLPELSSRNSYELDLASRNLTDAIRFAREETIRTGVVHGLDYTQASDLLQVYRVDSGGTHQYDVYHPVDKQLLWLDYSATGNQAPVKLLSVTLRYGGNLTDRNALEFDTYGTPRYLNGTGYEMLDTGEFKLSDGTQNRKIIVSSMTGRVTIQ